LLDGRFTTCGGIIEMYVEDGRIHFRPDIYHLDGTGFVTGQPQPRGEF